MKDCICCFCGKHIDGHGNNPSPLKADGSCCDKCNNELVIPYRISILMGIHIDAMK